MAPMSIDGEQPDEPHQARTPDGVFTLAQAMAEGLTRRQARSRLEAGRWHRIAGRGLAATPPPRQGWPDAASPGPRTSPGPTR